MAPRISSRQTGRIQVRNEEGQLLWVIESTDFHEATTFGGAEWVPGLKGYRLESGEVLNLDGDGFKVVSTGEVLTRVR
jgi:hypothetical protein